MNKHELRQIIREEISLNDVDTPEQIKIKKIATQYVNLRKAIDDPNYPDTPHTKAVMLKIENILKQMNRKEDYRLYLLKILPTKYQDFLK